ncbi:MAG: hypothetical protein AAF196_06045 [Planctomycetota bacterium]
MSPSVPASVPAGWHRHPNGGGLVEDTATVDGLAYVGPEAVVRGKAVVSGFSFIGGTAQVFGGAVVEQGARVTERARVGGLAGVQGRAIVFGDALVHGVARVEGHTVVGGTAELTDSTLEIRCGGFDVVLLPQQGDSEPNLRIGCTELPLSEWPGRVDKLCSGQAKEEEKSRTLGDFKREDREEDYLFVAEKVIALAEALVATKTLGRRGMTRTSLPEQAYEDTPCRLNVDDPHKFDNLSPWDFAGMRPSSVEEGGES